MVDHIDDSAGVVASLGLPGNPLAGAVYAGHHMLWKAEDTNAERKRSFNKDSSVLEGYSTSNSLSGLAKGVPIELAWHSGDEPAEGYFGLRKIGAVRLGFPMDPEDIVTREILQATALHIQVSAETTAEKATALAKKGLEVEPSPEEEKEVSAMMFLLEEIDKERKGASKLFDAATPVKLDKTIDALKKGVRELKKAPILDEEDAAEYVQKVTALQAKLKERAKKWEKARNTLEETIKRLQDRLETELQNNEKLVRRSKEISDRFIAYRTETRKKMKEAREKVRTEMQQIIKDLKNLLDDCLERARKLRREHKKLIKKRLAEVNEKLDQEKKKKEKAERKLEAVRIERTAMAEVIEEQKEQMKKRTSERKEIARKRTVDKRAADREGRELDTKKTAQGKEADEDLAVAKDEARKMVAADSDATEYADVVAVPKDLDMAKEMPFHIHPDQAKELVSLPLEEAPEAGFPIWRCFSAPRHSAPFFPSVYLPRIRPHSTLGTLGIILSGEIKPSG